MKKSILFVDDEKPILRSLSRLFFQTDYEVFTAESVEYALKILKSTKIDLVVSDMRMPGMQGNEFLEIVKEKYPHIERLILSGYADEQLVIDALENNLASTYMFKPWVNSEMLNTVSQLIGVVENK